MATRSRSLRAQRGATRRREFHIIDPPQNRVTVENLSRETAEQLYLVTFDPERARGLAELVEELLGELEPGLRGLLLPRYGNRAEKGVERVIERS